ncbi:sigma-70 family RNA polymerase sigma factor [Leucobacter viscericola]|uniref:Sigma-70 family RNA polymerase sigma factor n=1 Tax=Leucobacter viscericola TaxID=2714935 RepID=A0A6G7XHN9_9MICO|nr:sigma-70 family RNA polymerase sigma factor [Leucobacter viscericola]QIK63881.1 sigma-70 family RNA polymerase sigma factor [Leucobacter viscericola]
MTIDNRSVLTGAVVETDEFDEPNSSVQENSRFTDKASDLELLRAVREHDPHAYGELYRRHVDAARAAAFRIAPDLGVDDLVAESFTRIIQAIHRGKGPTESFRPYLYSVIRSVVAEALRKRSPMLGDMEEIADTETPLDRETQNFEHVVLARAFAKLPERWQRVLWHTEVEGLPPREVAKILGENPRVISQLVFRAKRGLREAWVFEHIDTAGMPSDCQAVVKRLEKFGQNELSAGKADEVARHLAWCRSCQSSLEELKYVSSHMGRGLSAVLLLGGGLGVVVSSNAAAPSGAIGAAAGSSSSVLGKVLVGAAILAGITAVPVAMLMNATEHTSKPIAKSESAETATPALLETPVTKTSEKAAPAKEPESMPEPVAAAAPTDVQVDTSTPPVTSNDGGDPPPKDPNPPATETDDDDTWTPPNYPTVVSPPDDLGSSSPTPDSFE